MKYKYLILFPLPEPFSEQVRLLMDKVVAYTHLPAPYLNLCPHITFHRPIEEVDGYVINNLVEGMVLHIRQTRITVSHLYAFGKEYIVLPVHTTRRLASFWMGLTNLLSSLPEYGHGTFDYDNTLHITIAEKTSSVFDSVWPIVKNIPIEEMTIPVEKIEIHRKPVQGGRWEKIEEYQIPK